MRKRERERESSPGAWVDVDRVVVDRVLVDWAVDWGVVAVVLLTVVGGVVLLVVTVTTCIKYCNIIKFRRNI